MREKFYFKKKNPTFRRVGTAYKNDFSSAALHDRCGVSAASRLALFPAVGRQNWTRLEYNFKGNNEHGPIKLPQKTTLTLAVTFFYSFISL